MALDFTHESQLAGPVAGVDEVGRGPWAGPVVACACILIPEYIDMSLFCEIDDSKKLSKLKRRKLHGYLTQTPSGVLYALGEASVQEIDQLNILQATFLAMKRAVEGLSQQPKSLLIDGNQDPKLGIPTQLLIKGDSKSPSIAAASIIAKVYRDTIMEDLAKEYSHYGWESNSGYGAKAHQDGLAQYGVTPHHRTSYAPIQRCLQKSA